jgi:hypothetical protein
MLEMQAPIHSTRKSRYSNALKTRRSKPVRLRERFRPADEVEDVAVEIGKEHQPVAMIVQRGGQERHTFGL